MATCDCMPIVVVPPVDLHFIAAVIVHVRALANCTGRNEITIAAADLTEQRPAKLVVR